MLHGKRGTAFRDLLFSVVLLLGKSCAPSRILFSFIVFFLFFLFFFFSIFDAGKRKLG